MPVPTPYILPLRGLGKGVYTYALTVDDAFFAAFPDAPVERADVQLQLTVDRRTREMTLDFDFAGTIATSCDRCLADIDLPIADQRRLIVKFDAEADTREDEGELIYLHPDTSSFDVAPYAYEMVLLAIPMIRTFDCRAGEAPYPCDEEMLDRIDASEDFAPSSEEERTGSDDDSKPSPWDVLKDLK
ncbi:MAG: DUF177 domain-containing protein [Bacteroidota bacterium]